ncbi:putative glycerol kinase 5 isoform X2 [Clytia hemisphaerica]|uniref:putative glycerol kinase 5 isoform X2 n=1 Tax=Clytia hemisphaerica TaxID=252671 RepID=UPI0034D58079
MVDKEKKFLLAVDFGSTSLVACIFDLKTNLLVKASTKVPYIHLPEGGLEINPEELWDAFVNTMKNALKKAEISALNIKAFGFCTQRGTFMLWNKNNGEPYTNFISWQDNRCRNVVDRMNHCWTKKAINVFGTIMYTLLRQTRFLLMKAINFEANQASMKLIHFFDDNPDIKQAAYEGDVLFGTIDTYIIWRLSKRKLHLTDISCASGTAMFDPYLREWSLLCRIFDIPQQMAPDVIDTSGHILDVPEEIFGASFPLTSVVADTQATVFGLNGFNAGDACAVLGTGSFLMVNTGNYCHASVKGVYPQIGWQIKDEVALICEGNITGIAPSIEWAREIGLYENVNELSDFVKTVEGTDGMYFIPAFNGLSAPYRDPFACTGFIGIKRNGTKVQMARAVCEGIAFRFLEMYNVMREETHIPFEPVIRLCGGISKNDFIMELISSLADCTIERAYNHDTSCLGAACLAGLAAGVWKDKEEMMQHTQKPTIIKPDPILKQRYLPIYKEWKTAAKRCLKWYT